MMHNAHHILRQYMKFLSVTIQAKATEQCFLMVMFITLYKVVLGTQCGGGDFCSHLCCTKRGGGGVKLSSPQMESLVSDAMKATQHYFHVLRFITKK